MPPTSAGAVAGGRCGEKVPGATVDDCLTRCLPEVSYLDKLSEVCLRQMGVLMSWDRFFSLPETVTIWDLLNSNAIAALLGAYLTYTLTVLTQRTRRAEEKAEDAQTIANASEASGEIERQVILSQQEAAPRQGEEDWRDQTAELVARARTFLQERVHGDTDLRHQRTYNSISFRRPSLLAAALQERGQITEEQMKALIEIFTLWQSYERGHVANRPVPAAIHNKIDQALRSLPLYNIR